MPDVTLKTLSQQIVEFGIDVDGRLDSMDQCFDGVDRRLERIETKIDQLAKTRSRPRRAPARQK